MKSILSKPISAVVLSSAFALFLVSIVKLKLHSRRRRPRRYRQCRALPRLLPPAPEEDEVRAHAAVAAPEARHLSLGTGHGM